MILKYVLSYLIICIFSTQVLANDSFDKAYSILEVDFDLAVAYVDSLESESRLLTLNEQVDFHDKAARFFSTIGDFEKEVFHWQQNIELLPPYSDTVYGTKIKQGLAYVNSGKFDQALHTYQECASHFSKHVNPARLARSYNGLAMVHGLLNKRSEAIVYYNVAISIYQHLDIPIELSFVYSNMGILYREMGEMEKSAESNKKAYDLVVKEKSELYTHYCEVDLASSFNYLEQYDSAIFYLKKAELYFEVNFNAQLLNGIYNEMGRAYSELGDNKMAEVCYVKSIDLLKAGGFDFALPGTMGNYGNVLNRSGQYLKAVEICSSAMLPAKEMGYLEVQRVLCECLYEGYKGANKYDSALVYFENLQLLTDSLSNVEIQKSVLTKELETNHGIEKQTLIANANVEINKEVSIQRYWIAGAVILFGFLILLYYAFRQKKKSEEAIYKEKQYLDNLLHNLVHEFRTPLTLIKGPTEQLLKTDVDNKLLQMVDKNSEQMLMLVNQVLDFAKIKAGRLTVVNEIANIPLFFHDIIIRFAPLAAEREIQLVNQVSEINSLVQIDTDKLFKIVSNLVSNAIKYSNPKALVTIKAEINSNNLIFTIQDTGIGISEADQTQVFKKFYQVDATITRKAEGTGLGLAFVQELVTLMQGKLSLESKLNVGTKITVTLPVTVLSSSTETSELNVEIQESSAQFQSPQSHFTELSEGEKKLILIIEDNSDLQNFLSQLLTAEGYEVQIARDGVEGVEKAEELLPDLVISDVMMPRMDGLQVVQKLKSTFATDHIPIIMLTAKVSFDSMMEGLSIGADDYLSKPFKSQELMLRVANQIQRQEKLHKKYKNDQLEFAVEVVKDPLIQKIEEIIVEDLSVQITVEDLAQKCALSRSQLHRKIKFLTGLSTTAMLTEIRLNKSKIDLRTTALSISEIAYKFGYNDPAHYSKLFKKQFDVTPSDYRNHPK